MIDLTHITRLLRQRTQELFPQCQTWSASDWFLELIGEVGETANIIKKFRRGDTNHKELREKLEQEFSDIFLCTLLNADYHNINLEKTAPEKFNLNSKLRDSTIFWDSQDPNPNNMRIYGLEPAQIAALIAFFRSQTGLDPVALNMTVSQIRMGKM